MFTKRGGPAHKQKAIYSLTEPAIQLVPVMAVLGAWGRRWLPVTDELSIRARLLDEGGPALWDQFMAELREEQLGGPVAPASAAGTVRQLLQQAYLEVVARGVG